MAIINRQTIARLVKTNALRKGLLGGHPLWRAVWVLQLLRSGWSRISKGGEAPVTFSEPLAEGTAWTLVHVPENSKRGRGDGRQLLVGPKRARPRATALAGPALSAVGSKILEAPSAERINAILGENVVSDPPLSRRARRKAARADKRSAKAAAKAAKAQSKADAAAAKAQAKVDAADAKVQARRDAKAAKVQARSDAAAAKADAKAAKAQARSHEKAAKKARKHAKRTKPSEPSRRQVNKQAKADKRAAKAESKAVVRSEAAEQILDALDEIDVAP